MIKLVRVDHRLLHGQVIFAWTKSEDIERIIIIDDKTSTDDFKKMSLKLTKPEDVKLNVFSTNKAISLIPRIKELTDNIMILFSKVKEMSKFVTAYGDIKEVNYGGVPNRDGAKQYSEAVFLTPEEVEESQNLKAKGVILYIQQVPSRRKEILNEKI